MSEQAIVLNELTKHYGKHRGINNLSFSVNQGEFFGFIGPNGAGKSTTIRTLMGLIRPTGGSASIFDLDCHSKASVIARDVGYLPSENSYYENMKVRELLQYTADLYNMDCKTKMKELADRLNLDLSRKINLIRPRYAPVRFSYWPPMCWPLLPSTQGIVSWII
ncbi:ATP-binding cassette domain-containing protein [Lachnoclostridium sp. An118]|uniref:ATP-binding cassette domain-containing protein n=1 Tax=Lachnoclostridium sp. An118 TaxID=1965547 RepID=UPI001FA8CD4C|nr:ATP-binding cassette domain-containing protein [Lachnoclostridium sp. An118]